MPEQETETEPTSFTQDDVTAAATRAAKEAERKARQKTQQDIADQLGCTVDEAKALIDAQRKAAEAEESELDRARKALAEANSKVTAAETRATQVTARATATTALLAAGLNASNLADGLRLIDVDPEDDADAVAAKAAELAERLPALFTTDGTGTPPPPPGIKPPKPPAHNGAGKSAEERALAHFKPMFSKPNTAA